LELLESRGVQRGPQLASGVEQPRTYGRRRHLESERRLIGRQPFERHEHQSGSLAGMQARESLRENPQILVAARLVVGVWDRGAADHALPESFEHPAEASHAAAVA